MKKFGRFAIIGFVIGALLGALTLVQPAQAGGKEIAEAAIVGVEKALVKEISEKPVKGAVVSRGSYDCVTCASELWGWDQGSYVSVVRCEDSYRNNRRYSFEYTSAAMYRSWWNDATGEYHGEVIDLDPENVSYDRGVLTATGPGVDVVCTEVDGYAFDESSRTRRVEGSGFQSHSRHKYAYVTATSTGIMHPPSIQGGLSEWLTQSQYDGQTVCKGACTTGGGKG